MKRLKKLSNNSLRVFAPHVYRWRMALIANATRCAIADNQCAAAGQGFPNLLEMVLFPFTSPSDAIFWIETYMRVANHDSRKYVGATE